MEIFLLDEQKGERMKHRSTPLCAEETRQMHFRWSIQTNLNNLDNHSSSHWMKDY
uniref:Uncharacterized protein n=1 Tax=Anguilla anguilla TaxID=7936 RepID=A0A0E9UFC5_ANGAN